MQEVTLGNVVFMGLVLWLFYKLWQDRMEEGASQTVIDEERPATEEEAAEYEAEQGW